MISSDIGMSDAEGMDQFTLDINTDSTVNLTNSPKVWDEHGVFSPDGKKIIFMSSYPYRTDTNSYKTLSTKTEFMLIDATVQPGDSVYYPGLEQLTHFNVPGYPESDTSGGSVAAAGGWSFDGTKFYGQDLIAPAYDNWIIVFNGDCGNNPAGISEEKKNPSSITIFPNPASQTLYLDFAQSPQSTATLKVMDIAGRTLINTNASISNGKVVTLDISTLSQGVYFLNIGMTQDTKVYKFIKE